MVYILNKSFDKNLKLIKVLQEFYGIGFSKAKYICLKCGLNESTKLVDINDIILRLLVNEIKSIGDIDQELKRKVNLCILNKKNINSYQGLRHIKNLPVRGQRTHTNGKTVKRKIIIDID